MKILVNTYSTGNKDAGYNFGLINVTKDKARRFIAFITRLKNLSKQMTTEFQDLKSNRLSELVFAGQRTPAFAFDVGGSFTSCKAYDVFTNEEMQNPHNWNGRPFIKVSPSFAFKTQFKMKPRGILLHVTEEGVYWEVKPLDCQEHVVKTDLVIIEALEIMATRE